MFKGSIAKCAPLFCFVRSHLESAHAEFLADSSRLARDCTRLEGAADCIYSLFLPRGIGLQRVKKLCMYKQSLETEKKRKDSSRVSLCLIKLEKEPVSIYGILVFLEENPLCPERLEDITKASDKREYRIAKSTSFWES
nr:hypothetical protein CFP56_73812 [Quercus suber]